MVSKKRFHQNTVPGNLKFAQIYFKQGGGQAAPAPRLLRL